MYLKDFDQKMERVDDCIWRAGEWVKMFIYMCALPFLIICFAAIWLKRKIIGE